MILADVVHDHVDRPPAPGEVLTTGQAAVLLGVSRPTLVVWLEAGRIPFHWRGTKRRVNRSEIQAYRHQAPWPDGSRPRQGEALAVARSSRRLRCPATCPSASGRTTWVYLRHDTAIGSRPQHGREPRRC